MNDEWTWSEDNDGWHCNALGLQMAKLNDMLFKAWKDAREIQFGFFPTPEQADATFQKEIKVPRHPQKPRVYYEANVRRFVVKYGGKDLRTHLQELGWENRDGDFWSGDLRLVQLGGKMKFQINGDTGSYRCYVSFPLTPEEARRALDVAKHTDQNVLLSKIQRQQTPSRWTEIAKDHWEHEDLGIVLKEHRTGLYLVWPKHSFSCNGSFQWAWARLGFVPSPEEAEAAIKLSPTEGKEMAPCYSRDQITRFLENTPLEQERQVALAAEVHAAEKGEPLDPQAQKKHEDLLRPCQKEALEELKGNPTPRLITSLKAKISSRCTECRHHNGMHAGDCPPYRTCPTCKELVSRDDSHAVDAKGNWYHARCWDQQSVTEDYVPLQARNHKWFNDDSTCNHPTCPKCDKEVSCMSASTEVGPNTYHQNCWRKMAKSTTAKEFGEAVHQDWEEKMHQGYTEEDVKVTKEHYDRCPKCHVAAECGCDCEAFLKEWEEAEGVWKSWPIVGPIPTWGISDGNKDGGYYWVILDFEPTVREARFCLQLSEHRGRKSYEDPPITRKIYAALTHAQRAHQLLKREGFTIDQKVLDRWERKLNGTKTYEEFVAARERVPEPSTPVFALGTVVDILDDMHQAVVVGRGRIVEIDSATQYIIRYQHAVGFLQHPVLVTRLQKVPKEEL